jgi:glycosyltransferase involved in cell wall biosynthesis
MTDINLDEPVWVNIVIPSYNTNPLYIQECLGSMYHQIGNYGFEIIWINDGSTDYHTTHMIQYLQEFVKSRKYTTVIYKCMGKNYGIVECLNLGLSLCKYDLIFRMDADDIMMNNRIDKQVAYMNANPDCMICGTNILPFVQTTTQKFYQRPSLHKQLFTWEEFLSERPSWFMNHPTLCFRKSAIDEVGNYNSDKYKFSAMEDFEIELRFLKKYGVVHTLPECLLCYRVHDEQITILTRDMNKEPIKNAIIQDIIDL